MDTPVLISFISYMLVMLGIGFYFYFKTEDLSDYVLGGRSLGPGVTALSAGASDMSGWLLLNDVHWRACRELDSCRPDYGRVP